MRTSIHVERQFSIPVSVIEWRFVPSGGPGGQHANRSNTRVEAVLDLVAVTLPDDLRNRLEAKLGAEVRVVVDDTRSQTRNRELALDRLESRLQAALHRLPPRRATRPSKASVHRRLDAKKSRSDTKRLRQRPSDDR